MNLIKTGAALAYVNWGRWIAECPAECGGALMLAPQQTLLSCEECGLFSQITWPADADGITDALAQRAVPRTRNWFPEGHSLALRAGCPHGQSVAELRAETAEHAEE